MRLDEVVLAHELAELGAFEEKLVYFGRIGAAQELTSRVLRKDVDWIIRLDVGKVAE